MFPQLKINSQIIKANQEYKINKITQIKIMFIRIIINLNSRIKIKNPTQETSILITPRTMAHMISHTKKHCKIKKILNLIMEISKENLININKETSSTHLVVDRTNIIDLIQVVILLKGKYIYRLYD